MPRKASPNSVVVKKSVTRNDFNETPYQGYGGIYQLTLPFTSSSSGDLPPYWSPIRDRVLKTTPMREAMWASAIGIATSKVSSSDWKVDGRKVKYWHDLILAADNNQSFVSFEEKQIRDFLLTDNGNHFEIVRTNDAAGARIIGIQHLPSWRVQRTGDPEIPAIYMDRRGQWHEMKYYQIVSMADEPDSDDIFFGTGHCAASRAFSAILKLSALELYIYEKISGKRPSRIYLVNANLNEKQLQSAMDASGERSNQKGYVMQEDAIIIPILDPSATASVAHIDLKGLPEDYKPADERIHAMLTYANAIGIDPVELDPNLAARGRALGSGSQAQVLDDKQSGKGLISYFKKKEYLYNEYILPDRVTFSFGNNDLVDRGRMATIFKTHVDTVRIAVGGGQDLPILTPEQAKQILAELGDIPLEFLAADLTDEESLRDVDKADILDIEIKTPVDSKLMLTEPKPEPKLLPSSNGTKPSPKAKESLIAIWTEKAYNERINKAEEWASHTIPNWYLLSELELLDIYNVNFKEQVKPIKVKEKDTEIVIAKPSPPQLIMLQPQAQPIHIQMPEYLSVKEMMLPQINVAAPNVEVHQQPAQYIIQMPEQPAPIVTIEPTVVNIQNDVASPIVNVSAPEVTVSNQIPDSPVPQVTVNLPIEKEEILDVIRNEDGLIERIIKKITNT